jgi:hypothetical protein
VKTVTSARRAAAGFTARWPSPPRPMTPTRCPGASFLRDEKGSLVRTARTATETFGPRADARAGVTAFAKGMTQIKEFGFPDQELREADRRSRSGRSRRSPAPLRRPALQLRFEPRRSDRVSACSSRMRARPRQRRHGPRLGLGRDQLLAQRFRTASLSRLSRKLGPVQAAGSAFAWRAEHPKCECGTPALNRGLDAAAAGVHVRLATAR